MQLRRDAGQVGTALFFFFKGERMGSGYGLEIMDEGPE